MYKIIGADGKEYGPVSAEQIRQWIAHGRANAETKAAAPGMSEWKALGDFPEFSILFASGGPPGAPSILAASSMRKTNGFAVAGMILGILSLLACCCYGVPFNILALIFSIIGLVQTSNQPQRYEGKGMAIAGLVLAIVSLLLALLFLLMNVATSWSSLTENVQLF